MYRDRLAVIWIVIKSYTDGHRIQRRKREGERNAPQEVGACFDFR